MRQEDMDGSAATVSTSEGLIFTASSVGSITDQALENNFVVINQVSRKKIIVVRFYIKSVVQPRDGEGTFNYCEECHRKEPIVTRDFVKVVVRYTKNNTSRFPNYITSNHQRRYAQFFE